MVDGLKSLSDSLWDLPYLFQMMRFNNTFLLEKHRFKHKNGSYHDIEKLMCFFYKRQKLRWQRLELNKRQMINVLSNRLSTPWQWIYGKQNI